MTLTAKIDISPDGSKLVAIGNFTAVDGASRPQIAVIDLLGTKARLSSWHTARFAATCSLSFDSYMRDIDISPDGGFFVITTTGAYGGTAKLCDSASRWPLGTQAANLQPEWVAYTGGDTTYAVAVTRSAVYLGGHFRWWNNPFAADRRGQGAVDREGLAALDPANGIPLTWNPGRDKGVGVFDLLVTDTGLWMGNDTDRVGRWEFHGKLAHFPIATGTSIPPGYTGALPGTVIQLGQALSDSGLTRGFTGSSAGESTPVDAGGYAWRTVKATMMIDGKLDAAWSNGTVTVQTFDGTTFGPASVLAPNGLTDFANEVRLMTSMSYDRGRLYFTLSGTTGLFWRGFTPQSGIVGAQRFQSSGNVTGITTSAVRSGFIAGDTFYWTQSDGNLRKIGFTNGAFVADTGSTVSGPLIDGVNWIANSTTLVAAAGGTPRDLGPTAALTSVCEGATCYFSAAGSFDGEGALASVTWDFGDGTTGNGPVVSHVYVTEGTRTVSLTVTDSAGASVIKTTTVSPDIAPVASFTATCDALDCFLDGSASTDGGGPVASAIWDFGDGTPTASGTTQTHAYGAAGNYVVTLTVADNEGASVSTTRHVSVAPFVPDPTFVSAARTGANSASYSVTVPAQVAAGDTMVLALALARSDLAVPDPTGSLSWQRLGTQVAGDSATVLWRVTATAAAAGTTIGVTLPAIAKGDLTVLAYRGVDAANIQFLSAAETVARADHTTPSGAAAVAGDLVLSYWAEKSSATTAWTAPAGVTVRSSGFGTGGGRVSTLVTDAVVSVAGPVTGLTATANSASAKATMWTVVLPKPQG